MLPAGLRLRFGCWCLIVILAHVTQNVHSLEEDAIGEEIDEDDVDWEEEDSETVSNYKTMVQPGATTYSSPRLTTEDKHSIHMSRDLLCDACRIVTYVMTKMLNKVQSRYKEGHMLKESEVLDILEKTCHEDMYSEYGIKELGGVRRLSGEGLETHEMPNVMETGGRWPFRLRDVCEEYVGEFGDETIYDHFRRGHSLEQLICRRGQDKDKICPPNHNATTTKQGPKRETDEL